MWLNVRNDRYMTPKAVDANQTSFSSTLFKTGLLVAVILLIATIYMVVLAVGNPGYNSNLHKSAFLIVPSNQGNKDLQPIQRLNPINPNKLNDTVNISSGSAATQNVTTTLHTSDVNGTQATSVTVNGQNINVPNNGATQINVGNVKGSVSHTAAGTGASVNSTSLNVSTSNETGGN